MNTIDIYKQENHDYLASRRVRWDALWKNTKGKARYYNQYINRVYCQNIPKHSKVLDLGCGTGDLLAALEPSLGVGVDLSDVAITYAKAKNPALIFYCGDIADFDHECDEFDYIIMSDVLNEIWDVQSLFENVKRFVGPNTRIIINNYSNLWRFPVNIARKIGISTPKLRQNWLTPHDVNNLLGITGFEVIRSWPEILCPFRAPGANLVNRYLAKIPPFNFGAVSNFFVARSCAVRDLKDMPSASVVIAARNESGHIDELIRRVPKMGPNDEIIFVEGNSTDDTYDVIKSAIAKHPGLNIKLFKQPGKGKGDAVRKGFSEAKGDILFILDADITVPPEDLPRFYELIASDKADFVNGVRLVYPMEDNAMRFANLVGNKFFSLAFSWLLGQPIRDTLCGTKVIRKLDYVALQKNRSYFGDFDPFGDFDLLFGAAKLNLKIMEVPIRYRARRYGETNIERWKHGVLLLKMVAFAARRIKFV